MRKISVFVKGPGSGRETAIRTLQAEDSRSHQHPGDARHTVAGSGSVVASRLSGGYCSYGTLHWGGLQAAPP